MQPWHWQALGLVCAVARSIQCVQCDPYDTVLVACWLTPEQEAQLSRRDGQAAAFWSDWGGRDSLVMVPANATVDGYGGFDGLDDAVIVVKAAGGPSGLYLLVSVTDDMWLDTVSSGYRADLLGVYLDSLSSDAIDGCTDCFAGSPPSTITTTTREIMSWCGSNTAPVYWRAYSWCYWHIFGRPLTTDSVRACAGLFFDDCGLVGEARLFEVGMRWSVFDRFEGDESCVEGAGIVPAEGNRRAFTVDYLDKDSPSDSGWLSWRGNTPWAGYYWGDIEFGPGFPSVPTPVESLLTAVRWCAESGRARSATHAVQGARFYTLTGRRVAGEAAWVRPAPDVVVRESKSGRRVVVGWR